MNINKAIRAAFDQHKSGDFQQAELMCRRILKKQPKNFDALHLLGVTHFKLGNYDSAIKYIDKALHFNSSIPDIYINLGAVFRAQGQYEEAITCYQKALRLNPNIPALYNNLGNAIREKGQHDEAMTYYQKALELNPNYASAHYNLGNILQEKGQHDEAISYYQKALQLNPNLSDAHNNLGLSLREKGQIDDAIACYNKALQLDPYYADAYNSLGNAFREKGLVDSAIASYRRAIECNPDHTKVYNNLGNALQDKKQLDEAITCYQKALVLDPSFDEAYCNLFFQFQQTCAWKELEVMTAKLNCLTSDALDTHTRPAESPFLSIIRLADPSINLAIATLWSREITNTISNVKIQFSCDDRKTENTKIVIGYLSNDFRYHATAHLMLSLFGLHNRDEFEVFCYSYGPDDRSSYMTRIQSNCDKFVDVSRLSHIESAKLIHEDQVDILVDLKGHTKDNRLSICALRPAPIQASYLGFPGSTGADFFDYIITDKIVTPEDHASYYSENFVYMPYCYQVNDHTQLISNKDWKREDFGLSESSFVFCSFNQPYKIDCEMFDVWMRILQQVPEGVLWLLCGNRSAEENLRWEAKARGVKSERLIFTDTLPKDEHLSRLRFADLALDTRIVNGHTTTSDALWAGVPVITLQGNHFASRVSSSILSAIELPELITHTLKEYEELAVRLANDPLKLQDIQQRIARNRPTAPLFDTPRFVRNLETVYKEMWKIFLAGESPRKIEIVEIQT